MRGRNLTNLIVILVLAFGAIWVDLPDNPGLHGSFGGLEIDRDLQLRLGLDLQGGLEVLLGADLPEDQPLDAGSMEAARGIIESRVNALGVSEPLIQIQGSQRVVVELPGVADPERAIATIGQTGLLEFAHMGQDFYPPGALVLTTESAAEAPEPGAEATA
ncbi:MAG: protein translocase subunit SecD, partial [Anaerolineae bacterium]